MSRQQLKQYFDNVCPRAAGGIMWTAFRMGHDLTFETMIENIGYWLGDTNQGIWRRGVQAAKEKELGWLLYGPSELDRDSINKLMQDVLGMECEVCYKQIYGNEKVQLAQEQRVFAWHLIVEEKNEQRAKKMLYSVYGTTPNGFPAGIKMQFVPSYKSLPDLRSKKKVLDLRQRHSLFLKSIGKAVSYKIALFDSLCEELGCTLQESCCRSLASPTLKHPSSIQWTQQYEWNLDATDRFYALTLQHMVDL